MPNTLWTPDGDVPLDHAERGVEAVDPRAMFVIQSMHTIAQKHRIVLACVACRQPFQGLNDGHGSTQVIRCGCRELRAKAVPRARLTIA